MTKHLLFFMILLNISHEIAFALIKWVVTLLKIAHKKLFKPYFSQLKTIKHELPINWIKINKIIDKVCNYNVFSKQR
jgi:hypothetical protein